MPKVLLITADQWRGDCLGISGHACVQTPNLDQLARDATLFTKHFAQCSPCGPGRASLHTGMYLMNHRSTRNGTPLSTRFTNTALEVQKAGMRPALIGFTDTSVQPNEVPPGDPRLFTYGSVLPGFEQLVPGSEGPAAWIDSLRQRGYDFEPAHHPQDEPDVWSPMTNHPDTDTLGPTAAPARYPAEFSDTAFCVNHAIDYAHANAGTDWFLHLSLLRPHPPFIAPAPYHNMYSAAHGPAMRRHASPELEAETHPFIAYGMELSRKWNARYGYDMSSEQHQRQLRATYWGLMTEVDHNLGRLFETLKATGDYDETLIVFTSDHGEQLWDHWWIGKQSFFDQTFHIPLIIRDPMGMRGQRVDEFSENIDVLPTICAYLGLAIPEQCNGMSLLPWTRSEQPGRWRDAAFFELDFREIVDASSEEFLNLGMEDCNLSVLRDDEFKLVHFPSLPPLLFDLRKDPNELKNVASDRAYAETLLLYTQRLLSQRMRHAESTWTATLLTRKHGVVTAQSARKSQPNTKL